MAITDWSTQSATELKDWQVERHYLSDIHASGSVDDRFIFRTHVVSDGIFHVARSSGIGAFSLRRDWGHIRSSNAKTYTIYFPIRREFEFTQDGIHGQGRCDEMFILNGDRPLTMNSFGVDRNPWEMILAVVPAHILHAVLPHANRICGRTFATDHGLVTFTRQIFSGILNAGDEIGEDTISRLVQGGLDVFAKGISAKFSTEMVPIEVSQAHSNRVKKYIDQNLCEQSLSVALTAAGCGISRRYIHLLMSRGGTTFTDYVRTQRLDLADRWLRAGEFAHFTIEWIASAVGFKSCSHFSRLYRARFGCSPREARLLRDGCH
jgi:AraC-like DNA-binding protein